MTKFICEYCGKEFEAKSSSNRKYCCKECSNKAAKGKTKPIKVTKVLVKCAECGKEEYVAPSRAEKYVCCSVECLAKYNSKRYSQKIKCVCEVCGKEFELKPYSYNRAKHHCCSVKCASTLKETLYLGERNHQYNLKGELNASFKGHSITHTNHRITDIYVYEPTHPKANKDGRVTLHRVTVEKNWECFGESYFDVVGEWHILKEGLHVHHKDCNHDNNELTNLQIVTMAEHRKIHNNILINKARKFDLISGVLKQGELLENPEVDNQQLSESSNILESSKTNNRVQTDNAEDSNIDTSALLQQIKQIVDDDIV